jgi:hypothetical protein
LNGVGWNALNLVVVGSLVWRRRKVSPALDLVAEA